jgi:hypothetical protein
MDPDELMLSDLLNWLWENPDRLMDDSRSASPRLGPELLANPDESSSTD